MDALKKLESILLALGYSEGTIERLSFEETNGYCNLSLCLKKNEKGIKDLTGGYLNNVYQDVYNKDESSMHESHMVEMELWPTEYTKAIDKEKKEQAVANSWIKPVDIQKTSEDEKKWSVDEEATKRLIDKNLDNYAKVLSKECTDDGVKATVERKPWVEEFLEIADEKTKKKYVVDDISKRRENEDKVQSGERTDATAHNWKTPKPRSIIRYIFFKSHDSAENFAKEYEKDFEQNLIMHLTNDLSAYKIQKNVMENELYSQGYKWVLSFRMNGKAFEALEEVEGLKKRNRTGCGQGGGCCIRYKE